METRIELTNELRNNIVGGMRDLCYDAEYDFDESAFDYNLDKWAKNKAHLYNVFSKSVDFNANELAIVKDIEITRDCELDNACRMAIKWVCHKHYPYVLRAIIEIMFDNTNKEGIFDFECGGYYDSIDNNYSFYKENYGYDILSYADIVYRDYDIYRATMFFCKQLKIANKMKLSKALNKVFDKYKHFKDYKMEIDCSYIKEVRELDENGDWTGNMCKLLNFNQFQAQLNDKLSPKTEKKKLVISINPLDYITQSRGNSWSSCHAFNPYWDDNYSGCNKGATLTMMVDPSSVIAYIIDTDNTNDLWDVPKQNRQTIFISDNHDYIVQNVFYPQKQETLSKQVRNVLQDILMNNETWVHSTSSGWRLNLDTTGYKGYDDWGKGVDISFLKELQDTTMPRIKVGDYAYCVDSCEYIEDNCSVCADHCGKIYCEYCDEWHDEDDMRWIDYYGRYFCDSEIENEMYYCEDIGDHRFYDDCFYDEYDGYYYSNDCDSEWVEDYGRVCRDNIDNSGSFFYCEHCGNYYYNGYTTEHFDNDSCESYCDDCYNELELDFDEE